MWINSTIPALPSFSCRVRGDGCVPVSVRRRESSSKSKGKRLEGRLQNSLRPPDRRLDDPRQLRHLLRHVATGQARRPRRGQTLYYAYGRVIMASTCFLGVRPGKEAVRELAQPKVASLVLATCAAEAVYMLALYQAFACISPVYVTAIKRGGGVLLASFASMFFFKNHWRAGAFPIAAIVAGVVALCL